MAIIKDGSGPQLLRIDAASGAARVTLYDALGNAIESVTEGTSHYLGAAIRQDVHSSTLNSSTATILAGATWLGSGETSLGIAGIQVNTYADQPHTVFVDQSSDVGAPTNWDISDSWPVPSNFGISRTVQATGNWYRVRVRNDNGMAPTVVTRIGTALCPVVEAVPRALTAGGNLKVSPTAEWQDNRTVTGLYACSSFRTLGVAAATQNLFSLENPAASTKNVVLRDLTMMSDSTAPLATVAQQAILSRSAVPPTGGTVLTPAKYRTSYPNAVAIPRAGTAGDGGIATAIIALPGTSIWQQLLDRPHTSVGWMTHLNYKMVPDVGADLRQLILAPGESILIQLVTSVPTTTHLIVNAAWTEYLSL